VSLAISFQQMFGGLCHSYQIFFLVTTPEHDFGFNNPFFHPFTHQQGDWTLPENMRSVWMDQQREVPVAAYMDQFPLG